MSVWNLIAASHFALEEDPANRETVINVAIGSTYSPSDSDGDSSEDEITNFHDHLASSPHQSYIHNGNAPECHHPHPSNIPSGSNNFLQVPDGKTPCTRIMKRTTMVAKKESDRKLVDAWMRAKTPRPDTAKSDVGPSWEDTMDINHEIGADDTETCFKCGEGFHRLLRCRVCGRSIHTPKCVYNETNGDIVVTATSLRCYTTGFVWSCPDCENLLGMLEDEEMIELMESFDDLDVDCDSRISLDDFLKYKHKHFKIKYRRAMDLKEVETAVEEFQRLDKPKTGMVDWWSFVDSRIVEKLSDRSKSDLVVCLQPLEIAEAKMFFRSFDADADGKITLREAEKAYERWFASLWSKVLNCSDSLTGPKKNSELSKRVGEHVKVNVKIFMEADIKQHGTVSWSQFLRDQSIYILAARRNAANLYKIQPRPDELEIIQAETSYISPLQS